MSTLSVVRGARSLILAALAAVVVAGCGSSQPASSPLNSSLSYFPSNSPFVASIVTSPNAPAVKGLQAMLRRIPFATFGEAALISQLQQKGLSYDANIRPLFGNPVLVGLAGPRLAGSAQDFLVVWITKDASALSTLVNKIGAHKTGSHGGATLYATSTNETIAVDGATFVAGRSAGSVEAALDRHAARQGMGASDYNRDLGSLPRSSFISAFGNLTGVLSSPKAASARKVPWVAALRSYGVSVSAGSNGLTFRYTLNTGGAALTSSELPLASGTSPPGLAGTMPIQFGLRQPAAVLSFILDAERRAAPASYAKDHARMAAVERRTGVNFRRDVLGELGSNAAVESMGHGVTIGRIDVVDPAAAARTLRKLGSSALDVFGSHSGSYVTAGPGQFETVHTRSNKRILFGLVGSEFVFGTGSPGQLRTFAAIPAAAAPGAQGAAAFRIALPELIQLALHKPPSKTIQAVLSSLGDITGWISSSTSALTGSATLGIR